MLPEVWRQIAALQPLQTNTQTNKRNTHCTAVGISSMNFSAVDFNPYKGTDKSPSDEIESGQSLQSFLTNSAIASFPSCDFDKVSVVPQPPLQQDGRSQPPEVSQLNLLALLKKSLEPQEPALRIETVPVNLTVGVEQRFWLIHQASALRLPGQFSQAETECILKTTAEWDWAIEYRPRTPNCSYHLLCLLNRICTPQTFEVAV